MPTYSELLIRFEIDLQIGDSLGIQSVYDNALYMDDTWTWVNTRSSSFEVTEGTATSNDGETSAINFKAAFDSDHPTGYITLLQNNNEVVIRSELEGELFMAVFPTIPSIIGQNPPVLSTIEIEITQYDPNDVILDVTVMIPKYVVNYCDDFNTSRRVIILERAFVGLVQELVADVNPISIKYDATDDFKFSPIRPSSATVNLLFGTGNGIDFEEFWTADERQFLVQDEKDGTVEWSGFVLANGFSYDFNGNIYRATLEAGDGLSTLEAITFVDDNFLPYGNQDLTYNDGFLFPFSLIITEILKKLGLALDLWTCVDSYEVNMTKTGDVREADPLSAAYVNVKTYIKEKENTDIPYWYGSGEEWNCKDVLENILYMFGAKIYQEFGVWRVKTINSDIDYGTGATQRYWRKYNTAGVYLGNYEVIDDELNVPCGDKTKFLIGNDHVMSMDDAYKSFRMNYEYTFLRDGDTPVNFIPNGDFCDWNNTSILSAPTGWARVSYSTSNVNNPYPRIRPISLNFQDAGGYLCGVEIGTQQPGIPNNHGSIQTSGRSDIYRALTLAPLIAVGDDSSLYLDIWTKFKSDYGNNQVYPYFRIALFADENGYNVRNINTGDGRRLGWQSVAPGQNNNTTFNYEPIHFYLNPLWAENYVEGDEDEYKWRHFRFNLGPTPAPGLITFDINGLASTNIPHPDGTFVSVFQNGNDDEQTNSWIKGLRFHIDDTGFADRLQVTGVKLGKIPDPDDFPQTQDFVYDNENQNYSLQVDPITVYNGDLQDEFHISNIVVPSNTTGGKNFWDDLSDTYGGSSLGLLTVREIMRQYQKPYRILEGNVKLQDARFGAVYTFEVLPDLRFLLHRGEFNKQKQYIEGATFIQLSDDTLPQGGFEGGNTLDAQWTPTGGFYCEIGENGLNTGYVVTEEIDINPNSETFQDTREVLSESQDFQSCPLVNPRLYYFGSDDIYLDFAPLDFQPVTQISDSEIQISYSNDDGNYLYFVYLKSLPVVERITTPTSPNNILSDWIELQDVIIDGYIYRVMRTDYVMAEFTNFIHNFKFAE